MESSLKQPQKDKVVYRLLKPFQAFVQMNISGALVLLVCIIISLILANSPFGDAYHQFWETHLIVGIQGIYSLDMSITHWINDGLMAIFFFVIGLELKRELLVGELASPRLAILPILAAVGGAILPAIIYTFFNAGGEGAMGWGIPMATDIVFTLGILTLLGRRVPTSLKIFLTAFGVVDDLIAMLTVAFFYTRSFDFVPLLFAIGIIIIFFIAKFIGVRKPLVYSVLGICVWFTVFSSGIHATLAGVLTAMLIPVRAKIDADVFLTESRAALDTFEQAETPGLGLFLNDQQQAVIQHLEYNVKELQTPLQRMEHSLNYLVAFVILPLFVLANTNIRLGDLSVIGGSVSLGIMVGLIVGKVTGIFGMSWLAVHLKFAALQEGMNWRHIFGASWLGGVGFTMSIFIADLAFEEQPLLLTQAKIAILLTAIIAGIVGYLILLTGQQEPIVEE